MRRQFEKTRDDGPRMFGPAGRSGAFTTYSDEGKAEDRYFTIRSHDLICYRGLNDNMHRIYQPLLPFVLELLGCRHNQLEDIDICDTATELPVDILTGVRHVAVEYNPDWETPTQDSINDYSGWGNSNSIVGNAPSLWLIDYTIRRTKEPSRSSAGIREDRDVFYGNGCRLVSVRPSDTEWEFDDGTPLLTERRSVFSFANDLKKAWKARDVWNNYLEPQTPEEWEHWKEDWQISDFEEEYANEDVWDYPEGLQLWDKYLNIECGFVGVLALETYE